MSHVKEYFIMEESQAKIESFNSKFKTYQNIWNGTGKYENGLPLNPGPKVVV